MTTFKRTEIFSVSCPRNDRGKVVRVGRRNGKQRYRCLKCRKDFRNPNVYKKKRLYSNQQMGLALQSYFDGLSYREVARNIARTFDTVPPGESTIYRWVQDYGLAAFNAMSKEKISVGDRWVADEMVLRVDGVKYWLWSVMDAETRYILGIHLTPSRKREAAGVVIRKAIGAARKKPKTFVSDQLGSYIQPVKVLMPKTKHIAVEGLDAKISNNLSERLQNTFRSRTKTTRGFKSQETGQAFLEGWVADFNLLRPHMSLGNRTPAEMAGVSTRFRKWQDIVEKLDCRLTPKRPEWHFSEPPLVKSNNGDPPSSLEPVLGKVIHDKQFRKMDVATAKEALYPLRPKRFKSVHDKKRKKGSGFRKRPGF